MKKCIRLFCFAILLCSCLLAVTSGIEGTLCYVTRSADSVTNSFKPSYDPDTDTLYITITAKKTVENLGKIAIGPEGFSFILEDTQTGASITKVSDDKGLAVFPFSYTPDDVGKVF